MEFRTLLVVAFSLAFLAYGVHCLRSESMRSEFARYGLAHLRLLTGVLEVLGGTGLLVGLYWPLALQISSGGLALLMLLALLTRLRIRDAVRRWLPALALLLVNAYILLDSLGLLS